MVEEIQSNINSFAYDTCLSSAAGTILQNDINRIIIWSYKWLVRFNQSKSESLIISRKHNKPTHKPVRPILEYADIIWDNIPLNKSSN